MIGDTNLDSVNWLENSSRIPLHWEFLNVFANHNLTQRISSPTHYLGNTLDLVTYLALSVILLLETITNSLSQIILLLLLM